MSQKTLTKVVQILMVIAGVLSAVAAYGQVIPKAVVSWIGLGVLILTVSAQQIESRLLPRKGKKASKPLPESNKLQSIIALLLLTSMAGCSHYATAWRTVQVVKSTGTSVDKGIAAYVQSERKRCLKKHTAQTPEIAQCLKKAKKTIDAWRLHARPAVNSALIATVTGLVIAEKADKKDYDWTEAIQPGVCALLNMTQQYREILHKTKASGLIQYLDAAEVWICD